VHLFDDLTDDELVRRHEARLRMSKNANGKLGPNAVLYYKMMAQAYWTAIEQRANERG